MSTTALSIKQSPFQLVTLEHTSGKTRAYEITSDQLKIKNDVIEAANTEAVGSSRSIKFSAHFFGGRRRFQISKSP